MPWTTASRASSRWARAAAGAQSRARKLRRASSSGVLGVGGAAALAPHDAPGQVQLGLRRTSGPVRSAGSAARNSMRSAVMRSPCRRRVAGHGGGHGDACGADQASSGPGAGPAELGAAPGRRRRRPRRCGPASASTMARSPSTMAASWRLRSRSARPAAVFSSCWAVSKSPKVALIAIWARVAPRRVLERRGRARSAPG